LTSLGEIEIGQLSGLLRQAQEYRNTKDLAIPQCLRPTVAAYGAVRDLKTRASAPDVNRENLVRDLQAISLDNLDKDALVNLIKEFGWQVKEKANKNDAVEAIWVGVTGAPKPKAKAASPRTKSPRTTNPTTFAVEEYAQKITALKERANAADSTVDELEESLKEMKLDKLTQKNLVDLVKQLGCEIADSAKKAVAIKAIDRVVLGSKQLAAGSLS